MVSTISIFGAQVLFHSPELLSEILSYLNATDLYVLYQTCKPLRIQIQGFYRHLQKKKVNITKSKEILTDFDPIPRPMMSEVSCSFNRFFWAVTCHLPFKSNSCTKIVANHAIHSSQFEILDYLVASKSKIPCTLLNLAILLNNMEAVKWCFRNRFRLTEDDLNNAIEFSSLSVLQYLLHKGGIPDEMKEHCILKAVWVDDLDKFKLLETTNTKFDAFIMLSAASIGSIEFVKHLLTHGYMYTRECLYSACQLNYVEIVRYFIQTLPIVDYKSCIKYAASNGRIDVLKFLDQIGKLDVQLAYSYATSQEHHYVASWLRDLGDIIIV